MDEKLKKALGNIEMPQPMRQRILESCELKRKEKSMKKSFHKRPLALVALLALCICIVGMSTLAATGKLQGFFRDLKGWDGAIVGQVYEQATNEIDIRAHVEKKTLVVTLTLLKPDQAPYFVLEELNLQEYKLVGENGNYAMNDVLMGTPKIIDNQAVIRLPFELSEGKYQLIIDELVGSKKAEQDLTIRGHWECTFSVVGE